MDNRRQELDTASSDVERIRKELANLRATYETELEALPESLRGKLIDETKTNLSDISNKLAKIERMVHELKSELEAHESELSKYRKEFEVEHQRHVTARLGETTGFGDPAHNNSKGCGTIMRMAPVAFSGIYSPHDTAIECSALTHGHPTAGTAAAAFVEILIHLRNGMSIEHAARAAHADNPTGETANAIECALRASPDGRPETVESLGGGWVAEEALTIAIYAARTARDFASGINIAICHSGDSDSTGSIAGNMLGLMFPHQVWRHPLAEKIQCADRIAWLAQDMAVVTLPHARVPDDFAKRYPCI